MNIAGIFLPYSDRTWKFSRKLIIAAIFLATFVIVQNMVISTIFNGVCFDYPPPFPSYLHSQSGKPYALSMQQEYEATFCDDWIPDFISICKKKGFKLLRIWAAEKKPANCKSFENIFFIYPRKVFFCISTKPENRWRVVLRFCRQYFLLSITPSSISQCLYFVFWIPEKSEKKRRGKNINSWRPSLPGGCRPVPSGATITPAGRENTLYPTCQTCWYQ